MAQYTANQRYSFFTLLQDYKVVIPIIQRDYAQGRKNDDAEEIRTDFLDSLYDYLSDGNTHDLDFVYGTSETSTPKPAFIPLDGQQRLTTLFLLHWYLMQQVQHKYINNANVLNLKRALLDSNSTNPNSMFTYQTRQSSTDFCDKLVAATLDMNNLIEVERTEKDGSKKMIKSVAATLRDFNWFAPKWDLDPTVQSMLVMLDAIHEKFESVDHVLFLDKLLDTSNLTIAFIFMNLENYNLNDDLYILMNSRGKPLTPFENFKARYGQYIGTDEVKHAPILQEISDRIKDAFNNKKSTISSVKQYFLFNIDTKWTNLFWAYCIDELQAANKPKPEKVLAGILDKKIANFIRVIFTFQFALQNADPASVIKNLLQNKNKDYLSYGKYEKNNILSPEGVEYLIKALDVLANGGNKISPVLPSSKYFDEEKVFESIINDGLSEASYADLIRFHAYLKYIIYFGKDAQLNEWMRFVYNISDLTNTRTDDQERFANAIKSVTSLLNDMKKKNDGDILKYLLSKDSSFKMSHFSSWQVTEELIKAHLMCRKSYSYSINWESAIIDMESHSYFNGQIGFILEFSGIVDYFVQNKGFSKWTPVDEQYYYDRFMNYGNIARMLFLGGYEKRTLANNALFERAMMTYNWRYQLGYHNANSIFPVPGRANLLCSTDPSVRRDFSWRKLLHINTDDAFRHSYVKDLFEHLAAFNVNKSLQDVIDNANCRLSWIDAFVRYPQNMKLCKNGFIYFHDDNCFLLPRKNYSKDDAELFTYTIWKNGIESLTVDPKFKLEYKFANFDRECYPHIVCTFGYKNETYAIRIQTQNENWEHKNYRYLFENVNNHTAQVPQALVNCIQSMGFIQTTSPFQEWTLISKAVTYDDYATVQKELQQISTNLLTVI